MTLQKSENGPDGFTCLVIDDSDFARMSISQIVERVGGEVVGQARNGLEGVRLYKELNPDLVLLDITMPEMDGLEALNKIRAQDNKAKVIIVSAVGNKDKVKRAITLGALHFITKPIKADYVGSIIKSSVGID